MFYLTNAVKRCLSLLVAFVNLTLVTLFNFPMFLVDKARKAAVYAFESLMQLRILVGTTLLVLAGSASAAVPAEVTTAITAAVTDVGTIGAAILGVIIVIVSFNWLRRPIK